MPETIEGFPVNLISDNTLYKDLEWPVFAFITHCGADGSLKRVKFHDLTRISCVRNRLSIESIGGIAENAEREQPPDKNSYKNEDSEP